MSILSKRSALIFSIFTTFILLGFTYFISNERNRAAFGSEGYIESGAKFGVSIGTNRRAGIEHLIQSGLTVVELTSSHKLNPEPEQKCLERVYEDNVELDLLWDKSWRQGTICVASIDEEIVSIGWFYGMFQP